MSNAVMSSAAMGIAVMSNATMSCAAMSNAFMCDATMGDAGVCYINPHPLCPGSIADTPCCLPACVPRGTSDGMDSRVRVVRPGDRIPARSHEEAGHRGREASTEAPKQGAVHARGERSRHVQPDAAVQLLALAEAERAGGKEGWLVRRELSVREWTG